MASIAGSLWRATAGSSARSQPSWPRLARRTQRATGRPVNSRTSRGRRGTAGAAGAGLSPRPKGQGCRQPALCCHLARPHRARGPTPLREHLLREHLLCARRHGKPDQECQLDWFADRTPVRARGRLSAKTMRANRLRLGFASMTYVLVCARRRIALHHSQFAAASGATIRLKLLKIGALGSAYAASRSRCPRSGSTRTTSPAPTG